MIARSSPKDATPITFDTPFPEGASSAIYVGTGGDLSVIMSSGKAVVYRNVPGGGWFPAEALQVNSDFTTATQLVAGYY